jgi:hypothetical protein
MEIIRKRRKTYVSVSDLSETLSNTVSELKKHKSLKEVPIKIESYLEIVKLLNQLK